MKKRNVEKNYFGSLFDSSVDTLCDLTVPANPPKWLDKKLYLEGRKFFWDHVLVIMMVYCQNLVVGLSIPNLCNPLVLTEKSETIAKAFRRYAHTGLFILQLYSELPWEKNSVVRRVNKFHWRAADKIRRKSKDEVLDDVDKIFRQLPPKSFAPSNPLLDEVLLSNMCEVSNKIKEGEFDYFDKYTRSNLVFSNLDMALVQSAFFASLLVYPAEYGCQHATGRELKALAHVWRVMGYYMGMPDTSNFVQNNFRKTRNTLVEMFRRIFVPSMLRTNKVSMIMGKNVASSMGIDYHVMMYQTLLRHGIVLKDLWNQFTIFQKLIVYGGRFIMWIYTFAVIRALLNQAFMIMARNYYYRATRRQMKINVGQQSNFSVNFHDVS